MNVIDIEKKYLGKTFKAKTGEVFKFINFKDGEFKAATKGITKDWLSGCLHGPIENLDSFLENIKAVEIDDDPNGPKVEE